MKDVKEKEVELTNLANEVKSKMKLLNQINQQLTTKEPRNVELDKLIKEKEDKLRQLEDQIKNSNSANTVE